MAQTLVAPTKALSVPHLWTVSEYDRLPEDLFGGERTELLEGQIYVKMGQGFAHITAVRLVSRALRAAFGSGFDVTAQLPTGLGDHSKPEPDVLVLRGSPEDYNGRYPDPVKEIALVVEVSDTSLADDQERKVALYAKHGVSEYWIVNLPERTLEIRRGPGVEGYAETLILREGESVAAGGGKVSVVDVLPKVG